MRCDAAAHHPPKGMVLSNGPMGSLAKPIRAACTAFSGPAGAVWSRSSIALSWLSSPAGLRRSVVNPYVWDRDTVVAICGPLFQTSQARTTTRRYLQMLPEMTEKTPKSQVKTALIWGNTDPFFPSSKLTNLDSDTTLIEIDGGHHYHPVERPWAMADEMMEWARKNPTTT